MESIALCKGRGLYLKHYKTGMELYLKTYNGGGLKKNSNINLLDRPLINWDLLKYAQLFKVPNFRGVFMRGELPSTRPYYNVYSSGKP